MSNIIQDNPVMGHFIAKSKALTEINLKKERAIMNTLPINQVLKIEEKEDGIKTINARDLHNFLEIGKEFSNWIKDRINKYGFIENQDYIIIQDNAFANSGNHTSCGFKTKIEYHLTIDMAKELSMVEKNEKGKIARLYFIECEKKLREIKPKELSRLDILELAIQSEKERLRAIAARDEALATKAYISDKKTATALATASIAVREKNKVLKENEILKEQIGDAQNYKQVKAISFLRDYFTLKPVVYQQIGKILTKISKEINQDVKMIPDTTYGEVKAYHIDVINEFKNKLNNDNLLKDYRK